MKLLLISDHENSFLWDYYVPGRLDGIDLILSCGDLKPEYLSFLVTMGRAPCCMSAAITTGAMKGHRLRAVTASRTSS